MSNLLRNAKFWTALFGAAVALIGYFVGKYAPTYAEDVKFVIGVIEPIVAIILAALFLDSQNAKRLALLVKTLSSK